MNLQHLNDLYHERLPVDRNDAENLNQLCRDYPYFRKPFVILAKYYHDTGHYKFEDMLRQAAIRVKDRKALYEYIHGKVSEIQSGDESAISLINEVQEITETDTGLQYEEPLSEQDSNISKPGLSDFLEGLENIQEAQSQEIIPKIDESGENTDSIIEIPEVKEVRVLADEKAFSDIDVLNDNPFIDKLIEIEEDHEVLPETEKPFVFEFENRFKEHEELVLKPENMDIIGEEIETEFTFSGNGLNIINEDKAHIEEKYTETDEQNKESVSELNLRKYPVYDIEKHLSQDENSNLTGLSGSDIKIDKHLETHHAEMDFFAWLNSPVHEHKSEETLQDIEEVSAQEEPIESKTKAENEGSIDLIERFISINPQISRPRKEFFNPENMAKRSEVPDLDFVTETLAGIYYEQGNYELAIKAYEKLSLQNPLKQAYFADLIEKIKQERK